RSWSVPFVLNHAENSPAVHGTDSRGLEWHAAAREYRADAWNTATQVGIPRRRAVTPCRGAVKPTRGAVKVPRGAVIPPRGAVTLSRAQSRFPVAQSRQPVAQVRGFVARLPSYSRAELFATGVVSGERRKLQG